MKLDSKILFLTAIALIATSAATGALTIWQLKNFGQMAVGQVERLETEYLKIHKADGEYLVDIEKPYFQTAFLTEYDRQ